MSLDNRDPYRATRKQDGRDGLHKYEHDELNHSTSPSESSTTRLANSPQLNQEEYGYYQDDPYLPQRQDKKKKRNTNSDYLDELPSFNQPGQQETIAMELMDPDGLYNPNSASPKNYPPPIQPRSEKKGWRRLGCSGRKLVFVGFAFVIAVIIVWYLVWPRTPTLQYVTASLEGNSVLTDSTMEALWKVNFTVLNQENFVPTSIQKFAVSVIDANTGVTFGEGNSNYLMLRGRSIDQVITIPIYINYTSSGSTDTTFKDLTAACSTANQGASSSPKSLNVKFKIVYYIAGIVWHTVSTVSPMTSYFQCPTST